MNTGYFWPVYGERDETAFLFHPSRSSQHVREPLSVPIRVSSPPAPMNDAMIFVSPEVPGPVRILHCVLRAFLAQKTDGGPPRCRERFTES